MTDYAISAILIQLGLGGSSIFLFLYGMTMLALSVFFILLLTEMFFTSKEKNE